MNIRDAILEELEIFVKQNEDDFDRGNGKQLIYQFIEMMNKKQEFNGDYILCAIDIEQKYKDLPVNINGLKNH